MLHCVHCSAPIYRGPHDKLLKSTRTGRVHRCPKGTVVAHPEPDDWLDSAIYRDQADEVAEDKGPGDTAFPIPARLEDLGVHER